MKKIIRYQCEICQKKYFAEQQAVDCESRGFFNDDAYPIGLMYPYHHNGFVGIFAIAEKRKDFNPHFMNYSSYAARTEGYPPGVVGDDLGNQCGSGNSYLSSNINGWIEGNCIKPEHLKLAEFKRMVFALLANGITPSYYNELGELKEFKNSDLI